MTVRELICLLTDTFDLAKECNELIVGALEKQVPKIPEEGKGMMFCGNCGHWFDEAYNVPFCPSCGQAQNWTEDNN